MAAAARATAVPTFQGSRTTQGRGFAKTQSHGKTGTRFSVLLLFLSLHNSEILLYAVLLSLVIKPSPQSTRTTRTR
eukprot:scaffold129878_cov72-Phaeocystis_antarctica.AAC.1